MNWEQIKENFSFYHDIAMTVPNWNTHIKRMDEKVKSDPGWYANDQVEAQYKGPYRVHLKRRREYLETIITNWYNNHFSGTQNFQVIIRTLIFMDQTIIYFASNGHPEMFPGLGCF